MQPYDLCVVLDGDGHYNHQVWARNEEDAMRTITKFYDGTTIMGIVFGTEG